MTKPKVKRTGPLPLLGYAVTHPKFPDDTVWVHATTPGQAKYWVYRMASEYYKVEYKDFRATRAPGYDQEPAPAGHCTRRCPICHPQENS